ncbi:hypothetical protein BVC80_1591g62 [Macleaya cordata]|uniref:Uncharacterized protein n=1 Tax=Macleaya cordata TaxID=56857 RepID=A0A200QIA0_MACCD|nr:hypothetical protein BVC80_1591g62 [Macleaya cordata]
MALGLRRSCRDDRRSSVVFLNRNMLSSTKESKRAQVSNVIKLVVNSDGERISTCNLLQSETEWSFKGRFCRNSWSETLNDRRFGEKSSKILEREDIRSKSDTQRITGFARKIHSILEEDRRG